MAANVDSEEVLKFIARLRRLNYPDSAILGMIVTELRAKRPKKSKVGRKKCPSQS